MISLELRRRIIVALGIVQSLIRGATSFAQSDIPIAPVQDATAISRIYKIEIVSAAAPLHVAMESGKITATVPQADSLTDYFGLFASEFPLYPPDLIDQVKLKRIVLCHELAFTGQALAAIPDWDHGTLYLDVNRGAHSKSYQRAVIHHEFFHMIDHCIDGNVYRDEGWTALNVQGFTYGTGGKTAQDVKETAVLTDRFPGFLTHYATTAVEEDKAEVFAHMVVNSAYVTERANGDTVVATKVARMQELLAKFCPSMNDHFWKTIALHRRDD